jgi:hypothetical protein
LSNLQEIFDGGFDNSKYEPSNFELLPPGWLPLFVEDAELKQTKDGKGYYVKIKHSVINGEKHSGRVVFNNINIRNVSDKCETIGRALLSSLTRALGIPILTDVKQLVNGICLGRIVVKGDQNKITGYKAIGVPKPNPASTQTSQSSQSYGEHTSVTKSNPPWMMKLDGEFRPSKDQDEAPF